MTKNGELIESHKTEVATLKNDLKVKDGVVNNLNEKIKELEEVDVEGIAVVDAGDEVAEDVHVVGESIVGRIINSAIASVAVGLGGHEAEVVGCLEVVEVLHQTAVTANAYAVGNGVEFFDGFALHDVFPASFIILSPLDFVSFRVFTILSVS